MPATAVPGTNQVQSTAEWTPNATAVGAQRGSGAGVARARERHQPGAPVISPAHPHAGRAGGRAEPGEQQRDVDPHSDQAEVRERLRHVAVRVAHAQAIGLDRLAGRRVAVGADAEPRRLAPDREAVVPVARAHAADGGEPARVVRRLLRVRIGQLMPAVRDRAGQAAVGGGERADASQRHER
jgi:hypothetical protein